jgi:acyl-CoA synthetase (AMP-forming)/AMP-acid ligase II
MSEPVPPIGAQISALAALAPDEPAVSCDGRTVTRSELDASTNPLARAYAERGVGVGDYVTIVLPNSIEFVQAAVACRKLGAVHVYEATLHRRRGPAPYSVTHTPRHVATATHSSAATPQFIPLPVCINPYGLCMEELAKGYRVSAVGRS